MGFDSDITEEYSKFSMELSEFGKKTIECSSDGKISRDDEKVLTEMRNYKTLFIEEIEGDQSKLLEANEYMLNVGKYSQEALKRAAELINK